MIFLNKRKLFARIQNNNKNVNFGDFVTLMEAFGFRQRRTTGSHNIFRRKNIQDYINAQNDRGQAKPYQIKQFLDLVNEYNLKMEDDE